MKNDMQTGVMFLLSSLFLCSCAGGIELKQRYDAVNVCIQKNEYLSDSENADFEAAVKNATIKPQRFRLIQSCDTADSIPRLTLHPMKYDYATTAGRLIKPAITAASVFGGIYTLEHYGFWFVLWPMPYASLSFEVGINKETIGDRSKVLTASSISFYGDEKRQRSQISQSIFDCTANILENSMPRTHK